MSGLVQSAAPGDICFYCRINGIKVPAVRVIAARACCQQHEPDRRTVEAFEEQNPASAKLLDTSARHRRKKDPPAELPDPEDEDREEEEQDKGAEVMADETRKPRTEVNMADFEKDVRAGMTGGQLAQKYDRSHAWCYQQKKKLGGSRKSKRKTAAKDILDSTALVLAQAAPLFKGFTPNMLQLGAALEQLEADLTCELEAVRTVRKLLARKDTRIGCQD